MRPVTATRLAWGLCALSALLFVFALLGGLQVAPRFAPLSLRVQWWAIAVLSVTFVTFSIVGALVASHSPQNTIGWLFLGIGAAVGVALASIVYAQTSLPGGAWAEWTGDWSSVAVFSQITFVLLLFPNGTIPSPRWRGVVWLTGLAGLGQVVGGALTPYGPPEHAFSNPVGLESIDGTILAEGNVGWFLLPVAMVAAAASFVVRFRGSAGRRRQQLKWFALAASLVAISYLIQT